MSADFKRRRNLIAFHWQTYLTLRLKDGLDLFEDFFCHMDYGAICELQPEENCLWKELPKFKKSNLGDQISIQTTNEDPGSENPTLKTVFNLNRVRTSSPTAKQPPVELLSFRVSQKRNANAADPKYPKLGTKHLMYIHGLVRAWRDSTENVDLMKRVEAVTRPNNPARGWRYNPLPLK